MQKLSAKKILQKNRGRTAPEKIQAVKIILHNVRSMHNVGATFRNADAFGIDEIIISGFTPTPPRPEISKTAIGAVEFVDWRSTDDIATEVERLKSRNYLILGVEQTTESRLLPDFKPERKRDIALLFGNEVTGIDEKLLPMIDHSVEIPQYGHKHSLNVSVAVGITLYAFLEKFC